MISSHQPFDMFCVHPSHFRHSFSPPTENYSPGHLGILQKWQNVISRFYLTGVTAAKLRWQKNRLQNHRKDFVSGRLTGPHPWAGGRRHIGRRNTAVTRLPSRRMRWFWWLRLAATQWHIHGGPICLSGYLTHWGQNNMASLFQTTLQM